MPEQPEHEEQQNDPIALGYDGTELVQELYTERNVQLWENSDWYNVVRITRSIDNAE